VIAKAKATGAAVAAVPVEDTIKESAGGFIVRPWSGTACGASRRPRASVMRCSARPCGGPGGRFLRDGRGGARREDRTSGGPGHGDPRNIKITTAADIKIAEAGLNIKVGFGYDIHRLAKGETFIWRSEIPIRRAFSGTPTATAWSMRSSTRSSAAGEPDIGDCSPTPTRNIKG